MTLSFKQICAAGSSLWGLDQDGHVWYFLEDRLTQVWKRLPMSPAADPPKAAVTETDSMAKFIEASKRLAHLMRTWPTDGWDGAAQARAMHHDRIHQAEQAFMAAFAEIPK